MLLGLDDRMLRDIGLARDDVVYGMRRRAARNATPQIRGWQISAWTILIVVVSLIVALVAPDGSKVDPVRVTSCAFFAQGMMGAGNKWVSKCAAPYNDCRGIAGAPKHVC
jgi:hypothetical protein